MYISHPFLYSRIIFFVPFHLLCQLNESITCGIRRIIPFNLYNTVCLLSYRDLLRFRIDVSYFDCHTSSLSWRPFAKDAKPKCLVAVAIWAVIQVNFPINKNGNKRVFGPLSMWIMNRIKYTRAQKYIFNLLVVADRVYVQDIVCISFQLEIAKSKKIETDKNWKSNSEAFWIDSDIFACTRVFFGRTQKTQNNHTKKRNEQGKR